MWLPAVPLLLLPAVPLLLLPAVPLLLLPAVPLLLLPAVLLALIAHGEWLLNGTCVGLSLPTLLLLPAPKAC
jgi:hypothetical protein